jgi:hypothetical protein
MCVIYFAIHQGCEHSHFLGSLNCGCDCPVHARHSFHVEDSGNEDDCTVCVQVNRKQLDPEVVPVEYYPPGESFEVKLNKGYGMCAVERIAVEPEKMEEANDHQHRYHPASLSDVDSDTSEWRQDRTTAANGDDDVHGAETPHTTQATPRTNETTPNTRAHRNQVQNQLNLLPTRITKPPLDPFRVPAVTHNGHMGAWPPHMPTMWPPGLGVAGPAFPAPWSAPFPAAYPQRCGPRR